MLGVGRATLACFFAATSAQRWDKPPGRIAGRPLARVSGLQSIDEARAAGVLGPEQWSDQVGVELLSTAAFNVHGTQVVQTSQGIMPAVLDELQPLFKLTDKPRRLALIVEDMLEGYRPFLGYLVPSIAPVLTEFRKQHLPVFWTDRFHGPGVPDSLRAESSPNASAIMGELHPTKAEVAEGRVLRSTHLNKFADVNDGSGTLAEWLRAMRVDTLVITGAWTESCILATAIEAADQRELDVIVISDGVGSATPSHFAALDVMTAGRLGLVASAQEVAAYLQEHRGNTDFIQQPTFDGFEVVDGDDGHLRVYVSVWAFAGAMGAVAAVGASIGAAFTVAAVRHRIARCKPDPLLEP